MRLGARETSLLAFIAQRPNAEDARVQEVLAELTGDAKAVAQELLGQDSGGKNKTAAKQLAQRLKDWVSALA